MQGARQGVWSLLRCCAARATGHALTALVVPGPELAVALGLDLEAAGFRLVASPRHANVLMIVGTVPGALREAAAVLYAGMMRPRALLAIGTQELFPLPPADAVAECSQQGLAAAAQSLRGVFAAGAFRPDIAVFDAAVLHGHTQYTCPMHPEVVQDAPGLCPICGMTLIARETGQRPQAPPDSRGERAASPRQAAGEAGAAHAHPRAHAHSLRQRPAGDRPGSAPGGPAAGAGMEHEMQAREGEEHFMSMVAVTRDLPRSADGLPMDWIQVPFGPLFPGLPGGLRLTLTLDGDAVAQGAADSLAGRDPGTGWASTPGAFVRDLAALDPFAPRSYEILAQRALEAAAQRTADPTEVGARVACLERERVRSHLVWLSGFMRQLGLEVLSRSAARLTQSSGLPDPEIRALVKKVRRTPMLARRLTGLGCLPKRASAVGPVARAAGRVQDVRASDPVYRGLGYEPVVGVACDVWARLELRLGEIESSLALSQAAGTAGTDGAPDALDLGRASGVGEARIETPRGEARMRLEMDQGRVVAAQLHTPSSTHMALIAPLVSGQELGDALVIVGSLDLSPWEVRA